MTQRQTDDTARILKMFSEQCPGLDTPEESEQLWYGIKMAGQELLRQGKRFTDLFGRVAASDYLMGRKPGHHFRAQLPWLLRPETIQAVLAGKYDDRKKAAAGADEEKADRDRLASGNQSLKEMIEAQGIPPVPVPAWEE